MHGKGQGHIKSPDFNYFSFFPVYHLLAPKYFTGDPTVENELDIEKINCPGGKHK